MEYGAALLLSPRDEASPQKLPMQVATYSVNDVEEWERLVAQAPMATFLQSRRYLSYHADRFVDQSLLIKDDADQLLGVLPAALNPKNESMVISHPGITYGGLLHRGSLRGEKMLQALTLIVDHYRQRGLEGFRYKAIPVIYHQAAAQDDLYALFRLAARRYRCDLSCAIDLSHRLNVSERRRRSLKKAKTNGVLVLEGAEFTTPLWRVLTENLERKFAQRPVHSVAEITKLQSLFPANIRTFVGLHDSQVVAGALLFVTERVFHAQYIAASEIGQQISALDAVFEHCIAQAATNGARYFDFGISNENEGQYLNSSLFQYKSEFGGGGIVHEFFQLDLRS